MTKPARATLDIWLGDNLAVMRQFPDEAFDLIYIDPPFNTGKRQARTRLRTVRDPEGDRVGFKGNNSCTIRCGTGEIADDIGWSRRKRRFPVTLQPSEATASGKGGREPVRT